MINVYESSCMQEATGETLRPGGFKLTDKAVDFCALRKQDRILDLGCGMGATASYLYKNHGIKVVGIDPSEKLLAVAKAKNPFATFISGSGDSLPFENESFECVLAECTLSLMNDLHVTLKEVFRVLEKGGWFVINDVYAKNPETISQLDNFSITSCMRGMHDLLSLKEMLEKIGFEIMLLEDCSSLLKELMVKIIFSHGSMGTFWNKTIEGEAPQTCCFFEQNIKQCKPGYFILIGKKGEK
ncbi:DVU_1556 family methyltransferase [Sulfurospirillum oryzae]|uniref:DVU_1556 family methyltransferase n=1 Tax=Sulfurospirillum oryzae TaxID=2976535 RepID=UPI0021E85842|nr:class I SAM-dependent methyltransferase [Sulfurospirillum oryzae]